MSDDVFTRYYTTTAARGDKRVRDGCGHLHPQAADAIACSTERNDIPVVVDRAGRCIQPDDQALIDAFAAAVQAGKGGGGVIGRLAMRPSDSGLPGGGARCHNVPR